MPRYERKSRWKTAFVSLAVMNVLIIAGLIGAWMFMMPTVSSVDEPESPAAPEESAVLHMQASYAQVNDLLARAEEDIDIRLTSDGVELVDTYSILGQDAELRSVLAPEVQEDGNLVLHQQQFSFGPFNLPGAEAFEIIQSQADLPEGVTIRPQAEEVYVHLRELDVTEDFYVLIDEINETEEEINMSLYPRS
ncbi:uncharacterized protein YpmS [Salsuginibacillus halophilus]|uniref:Uncharacterized protein YpmS n=1 Tax=Salsuginibacillus halophilus TaxID=517424 RepID=A0A2P8HG13_9BACI|nr:YpmS family protein [Salsuginibacillus halophilus]PSL45159.1 uncharacterized protein YpmS [Salsuginibacillus halophilus]